MNRDYDNHDRFNIGQQCYPTVRFLVWCAFGMLVALWLFAHFEPSQAQTRHQGAHPDAWSASVLPALPRAKAWPRTYRLEPLPDVTPGHSIGYLDRSHLEAIIEWGNARQLQREDMARRHRQGIVHPDEL